MASLDRLRPLWQPAIWCCTVVFFYIFCYWQINLSWVFRLLWTSHNACVYSVVQNGVAKNVSPLRGPCGATHWSDKREVWHGERPVGPLPRLLFASRAKFHVYRGRNVGTQPPKLSNFRILAINLPLRGDSFAQFLGHSQHLYASTGRFWILGVQKWDGPPLSPCQVWWGSCVTRRL